MNIVWIDALVIDKGFEKKGVIKDLALKEVKVIVVGADRRDAPHDLLQLPFYLAKGASRRSAPTTITIVSNAR